MGADNGRPLQKELIAGFVFIRRVKVVAEVVIFEPEAIEFAEVPRDERRIADRPFPRPLDQRCPIEEQSGGPVFIQLQLAIAIAAKTLATLCKAGVFSIQGKPLAVRVKLISPCEPLIHDAAK